MDPLLVIAIIIGGAFLVRWLRREQSPKPGHPQPPPGSSYPRQQQAPPRAPSPPSSRPYSSPSPRSTHPHAFRPSPGGSPYSPATIRFGGPTPQTAATFKKDLKDLVDGLTGAPLQPSLGLYQCARCSVFYQPPSLEVIRSENAGRCVSCLSPQIVEVTVSTAQEGREALPSIVTLQNYRDFVGYVVTFEGFVHTVLVSHRGVDYAVMFEPTSWTRGLKMVVFRGDTGKVGGPRFLLRLANHKVRIRGLLIRHETFGYEIIVSDPAMILGVTQ